MGMKGFAPPLPNPETVFARMVRRLGYPPSAVLGQDVRKGIERAVQHGLEQIRVRAVCKRTPLLGWREGVLAGQGVRIRSRRWAALVDQLDGPEALCCFVLTLGDEVDTLISRMQADSIFEAYLLDAACADLVEGMADELEGHLSLEFAAEGYEITARFSPGYCDWKLLEGQEALFRFLNPESIGMRCTAAGMMIPRKSVSGAVVAARRVTKRVPCFLCSQGECQYRREARSGETSDRKDQGDLFHGQREDDLLPDL